MILIFLCPTEIAINNGAQCVRRTNLVDFGCNNLPKSPSPGPLGVDPTVRFATAIILSVPSYNSETCRWVLFLVVMETGISMWRFPPNLMNCSSYRSDLSGLVKCSKSDNFLSGTPTMLQTAFWKSTAAVRISAIRESLRIWVASCHWCCKPFSALQAAVTRLTTDPVTEINPLIPITTISTGTITSSLAASIIHQMSNRIIHRIPVDLPTVTISSNPVDSRSRTTTTTTHKPTTKAISSHPNAALRLFRRGQATEDRTTHPVHEQCKLLSLSWRWSLT